MMVQVFLQRIVMTGLWSLAFAVGIGKDSDREKVTRGRPRYEPWVVGYRLPFMLLLLAVLLPVNLGAAKGAWAMFTLCFPVFLQMCLYYPVLLWLLPRLRGKINARTCALLWLLPNYLYYTKFVSFTMPEPLVVIPIAEILLWVLLPIWFAGFLGILFWKAAEHLRFRRKILKDAKPISFDMRRGVWTDVMASAGMLNRRWKLMESPHISTPMTIGLFRRTTCVVLPAQEYTMDDLELILRHELVHIGRQDAWSKFFLVFCTALCWFNPLMWKAMDKSAEDLELSCDETVLLDADEDVRNRYARILLNTVGDERGFTTCLSASAEALRYRLKSIVKPQKRHSGAIVVFTAFFLLQITTGYVTFGYSMGMGAELLYQGSGHEDYQVTAISSTEDEFYRKVIIRDEAALHDYLAGLELYGITGMYPYDETERYYITMSDEENAVSVTLHNAGIRCTRYGEENVTNSYYVPGGLDWEFLDGILDAKPALYLSLYYGNGNSAGEYLAPFLQARNTATGEILFEGDAEYAKEQYFDLRWHVYSRVELTFSEPLAGPVTIHAENLANGKRKTIELTSDLTLELVTTPTRYQVLIPYYDQEGDLCEAEYRFSLRYR